MESAIQVHGVAMTPTGHPVRFRARLGRLLVATALSAGVGVVAAPLAGADVASIGPASAGTVGSETRPIMAAEAGADVAVGLRAVGSLLLPTISYDVSVTNHGPNALTAATVTLPLDSRAHTIWTSPCTFAATTDTVTCPFADVPVGATATVSFTAYFLLPTNQHATLTTTATRTASTPPDPNPSNDTATLSCSWVITPGWPGPRGQMRCPPPA